MGFYEKWNIGHGVKLLLFKPDFFLCKQFSIEKALNETFRWNIKYFLQGRFKQM